MERKEVRKDEHFSIRRMLFIRDWREKDMVTATEETMRIDRIMLDAIAADLPTYHGAKSSADTA